MDERKIDRTDEEGLIDLSRLLREARSVLRRLYWLPLALAAVMALLICQHGWRSYQPMYASEATFTIQVVSGTGSDIAGGGYGYYDKATAEQLGKTFPYLIQSDLMRGKLCRAMGVTTLNGTITAQTVSDTNLFTIRVTSPSAQDAKAILDKVIELYRQLAQIRREAGQPLLDIGLKRATRLGVQETIPLFNAEVGELIGETNQRLLMGLTNVPRQLRNDVLLEVATELILPTVRMELDADANVPQEVNRDFFAYLLSLGELIAFDYGILRGRENLGVLTYQYMDAIYRAFTDRES